LDIKWRFNGIQNWIFPRIRILQLDFPRLMPTICYFDQDCYFTWLAKLLNFKELYANGLDLARLIVSVGIDSIETIF
jgi:hypothetical protein